MVLQAPSLIPPTLSSVSVCPAVVPHLACVPPLTHHSVSLKEDPSLQVRAHFREGIFMYSLTTCVIWVVVLILSNIFSDILNIQHILMSSPVSALNCYPEDEAYILTSDNYLCFLPCFLIIS